MVVIVVIVVAMFVVFIFVVVDLVVIVVDVVFYGGLIGCREGDGVVCCFIIFVNKDFSLIIA